MIHSLLVVLTAERATYTKKYIPSRINEHGGSDSAKGCVLVSPLLKPQKLEGQKSVAYCNKILVGDGKGSASLGGFGVTPTFLGIPGMRYIENSGVNSANSNKAINQHWKSALPRFFHGLCRTDSVLTCPPGNGGVFRKKPFCICVPSVQEIYF
ncbi:hypothetical protein AVEN_31225-1 [Araneus ventricosus]|uniref:Uncharacterized protein n=1 Tax=Araneus ventricosus TaxID=182803 RepID=A0A4Y2AYI9_ARAVE|nr:hypothetical protein AVEN_31225-1 [Araneus ventricosus]